MFAQQQPIQNGMPTLLDNAVPIPQGMQTKLYMHNPNSVHVQADRSHSFLFAVRPASMVGLPHALVVW
jgi:hypothetical protein